MNLARHRDNGQRKCLLHYGKSVLLFVVLDSGASFKDIIGVKMAITPTPIHTAAACKRTSNRAVNDKTFKASQRIRQDFNVSLRVSAYACC